MTSWLDFWIGFGVGVVGYVAITFALAMICSYFDEQDQEDGL